MKMYPAFTAVLIDKKSNVKGDDFVCVVEYLSYNC